jgi:hypothetical protein
VCDSGRRLCVCCRSRSAEVQARVRQVTCLGFACPAPCPTFVYDMKQTRDMKHKTLKMDRLRWVVCRAGHLPAQVRARWGSCPPEAPSPPAPLSHSIRAALPAHPSTEPSKTADYYQATAVKRGHLCCDVAACPSHSSREGQSARQYRAPSAAQQQLL